MSDVCGCLGNRRNTYGDRGGALRYWLGQHRCREFPNSNWIFCSPWYLDLRKTLREHCGPLWCSALWLFPQSRLVRSVVHGHGCLQSGRDCGGCERVSETIGFGAVGPIVRQRVSCKMRTTVP